MPEAADDRVTWTYDHADSPWHVAFTPGMRATDVVTGDGEVLVRDGRPTRVDLAEVRAHAAEQAARLFARAADARSAEQLLAGLGVDALVVGELDEVAVGVAEHADVPDGGGQVRRAPSPGCRRRSPRRGDLVDVAALGQLDAEVRRTGAASSSGEPRYGSVSREELGQHEDERLVG